MFSDVKKKIRRKIELYKILSEIIEVCMSMVLYSFGFPSIYHAVPISR